jgi:hypothetical protein
MNIPSPDQESQPGEENYLPISWLPGAVITPMSKTRLTRLTKPTKEKIAIINTLDAL